jgi:circadian clock protein KaiC
MLVRLIDFLKGRQITVLFTSLTAGDSAVEQTEVGISSLIDTWILLRDLESNGERNRGLYVIKSRGMAHSNQVREFLLSDHGVRLLPAYLGAEGVLTGSARLSQEARERASAAEREWQTEQKRLEIESRRHAMETQIAALRAAFAAEKTQIERSIEKDAQIETRVAQDRADMAESRLSKATETESKAAT